MDVDKQWLCSTGYSEICYFGLKNTFFFFSRQFGFPEIKHSSRVSIQFKLGTLIFYNILYEDVFSDFRISNYFSKKLDFFEIF